LVINDKHGSLLFQRATLWKIRFVFFLCKSVFLYFSILVCERAQICFRLFHKCVLLFPKICFLNSSALSIRVFHPLPSPVSVILKCLSMSWTHTKKAISQGRIKKCRKKIYWGCKYALLVNKIATQYMY